MLLEDAFTRVVREPLEVLPGQEPEKQVIVMVDALDEALTYSGGINIVSLLAQVEYLLGHVSSSQAESLGNVAGIRNTLRSCRSH